MNMVILMINEINTLVLAYLGDAIYEYKIREYLINKKINKVDMLQKESIKYVSATSQSKILDSLLNDNILTEEELEIVKKARNYKTNKHPKNTDLKTYKKATSLEVLIGYLYLNNNIKRIDFIIDIIKRIV